MKFQTTIDKDSVRVRLVPGSLNKFVDKVVTQELQIGTGINSDSKEKNLNRRKMILLMRKVVSVAKQNKLRNIALDWKNIRSIAPEDISDGDLGELVATSLDMADYEHNTFKTKPKGGFASVDIVAMENVDDTIIAGMKRGHWISKEVNACRELSNTPGGSMTPKILAQAAREAVKGTKATVKVLGQAEMKKLGMGAVLGIAGGSSLEPQFIIMEYWGAGKPKAGSPQSLRPIALVGKGVTFDSGGLNLKPGDHMYEMHMDMSGGASVIHAVALAAKLKLKKNIIGLVPAVENMPGQGAVRPGDVLKSLSGKTIEVLNTDAEGRVILADGITYARKYNPSVVIDVATLTGASLVAIGTQASCFMTNKEEKIMDIMDVAEKSGDYMWPFPAWEEYEAMTRGTFGDVPNLSTDGSSRDGGVIAGGMFLREFIKDHDCLWIHIDMAPRMVATSGEFLSKGAVGAPVRFLLQFIESGVK